MEGIDAGNKTSEKIINNNENIKKLVIPEAEKSPEEQITSISSEISKEENTIISTKNSIDKIRQEFGLVGEETNIPSIEVNKNKKSKLEKALSSIQSNVSSFSKVTVVSAGLFASGNNLEASNIGQNKNDKVVQGLENVSSIEDDKTKALNGGNIEEVVVYGKKKYEEELTKQQENIKKFEAEMAKYQKDSVEWAVINKGYQDSLKLYNKSEEQIKEDAKAFGGLDKAHKMLTKFNSMPIVPNDRLMKSFMEISNYPDALLYDISSMSKQTGIKPIKLYPPGEHPLSWNPIFKKPTNEPIPPQKPENPATKEIKYDPKFEDLNMRSLWATILKQDPNAKIGTLHVLDPQFEKGFTLEEAMSFPQEIKDQYNIDYIYNQIHGTEKTTNGDYKHPGWDYNNPTK